MTDNKLTDKEIIHVENRVAILQARLRWMRIKQQEIQEEINTLEKIYDEFQMQFPFIDMTKVR